MEVQKSPIVTVGSSASKPNCRKGSEVRFQCPTSTAIVSAGEDFEIPF